MQTSNIEKQKIRTIMNMCLWHTDAPATTNRKQTQDESEKGIQGTIIKSIQHTSRTLVDKISANRKQTYDATEKERYGTAHPDNASVLITNYSDILMQRNLLQNLTDVSGFVLQTLSRLVGFQRQQLFRLRNKRLCLVLCIGKYRV